VKQDFYVLNMRVFSGIKSGIKRQKETKRDILSRILTRNISLFTFKNKSINLF
jgi:hypothetical protein